MRNKYIHTLLILITLLTLGGADAFAQRNANRKPLAGGARPQKEKVLPDSLELARRDSLHRADSLFRVDSLNMLKNSSLTQPAFSSARDSIVEVFTDGKRKIYYYGDVTVQYQDITLKAERMEYDLNTGVCYAHGVQDTLTGEWIGRPVMTQAGKTYNMAEVKYNFNNRKASIKQVITSEDDGLLHGDHVKMMPDKSINVDHGKYTVCDLEHPHYWMELSVAKVVTKPSRKTVFGPAHLVVADVHLPFVGIPFGFIPKRPERATGLLMPTFGEETARGFYMRDGGMYFVFGDYLDLSVTGDYYTLGSWALDVNSRYKINYKANGSFSMTISHDQVGEQGSPDFNSSGNFGLRWQHSQDSKAHPGTSFSASVNFSSPQNSKYNSRSVNEALQNQISSSISYSHNWGGKVNLSINALHSQNSRDSSYSFTLPNVTLSVSTFYPFKKKNRVGKEKPWEKISFGYSTSLQNKINFYARDCLDTLGNFDMDTALGLTDKFKNGMSHNFSIGLPSFQLFKYFNFNPSISYGQSWFFRASEAVYDAEQNKVVLQEGKAFNHFGITQTYSGSLSMSTRLYGMFNFGRYSKVQAIRHVISPSVSMSFSPEKGNIGQNGWTSLTYTDKNGEEKVYEYNMYQGQLGSYPSKGKSATANISIGNNLEAKVRDPADSTGKGSKKVKLLDQLNFSSGYNFLADSLKMSKVSASMSTNLFGKVNISASAAFDPYAVYAVNGSARRFNTFAVMAGQGLARFTNASASASYSISGKGTINGNDGREDSSSPADYYQRIYYHPVTGEYVPGGWLYYTNPNVPWSMNFNTSFNCTINDKYDKDLDALVKEPKYTATLGMSGNIKLTPRMSINASSGYDFIAKKITTTQISATYDLHCFNIAVSWVPLGTWQSYSFKIAANAASLADLLRFKKSSSYWDR
ncbi:MAG: LPS-assembly protein LptD [Bacteroidales bacterium]|nr:LPS-assembly protein LptD [Bacteroidales bacterium]